MNFMMNGYGMGSTLAWFLPFVSILALWSIVWKGLALWHAAERKEPWWFLALLLINTAGILEIIYLFAIAKVKPEHLSPFKGRHSR